MVDVMSSLCEFSFMSKEFQFVEIPDELLPIIGNPDDGTRVYRVKGDENGTGSWFEAFSKIVGKTVSPGGVSMFAPVSRAAVYKRLKEGRLTMFCYHPEETHRGFFGKKKKCRGNPYGYIPVSECKAWAAELEEKMVRLGHISKEELEGSKPDWVGDFLKWESKWRKEKNHDE